MRPATPSLLPINTPSFRAPFAGAGLTGLGSDCEGLLQCLPMPAYLCDLSDGLVFQNEAAARLWGGAARAGRQEGWSTPVSFSQIDGASLLPNQTPTALVMREHGTAASKVLRVDRADGSSRRVVAHPQLVRDGAGNIIGALCFLSDVTECSELEERLQQVGDKKHEFIAMLGHEIRNPLSPILSAVPLLKKTSNDIKVAYLADMIERQATNLSRFVTDLLDEAHVDSDGATLNKTMGSLDDVLNSALEVAIGNITERGQTLRVRREPGEVALICDVERLAQAIGNIVQNASDFTGDAGTIVVTVNVRGPLLEIDISDSGIGMRPGHVAAIFHPRNHAMASSGAGMGVKLAMEICQRHGGAITASSPGLGLGSRVCLVLPVALPLH